MKKNLILVLAIIGMCRVSAQNNFVLQNETAQVFTSLTAAIDAATDGDTLYLPGGAFPSPGTVSKSLVWLGVGHYPQATTATGPSQITGNITFTGLCDGTFLSGIYFTGYLYLGSSNDNALDFSIQRCRIDGDLKLKYGTESAPINFTLSESVTMGNIIGNNASGCLIEKTVLSGSRKSISTMDQSAFNRLISLSPNTDNDGNCITFSLVTNSSITNCIFNQTYNRWLPKNCSGNTIQYNLVLPGVYNLAGNTESNNYTSTEPFISIFTNITSVTAFAYDDDFHLKTGVIGTNLAEDGTDLGIYGGSNPYKADGIPFTPHISRKVIGSETINGMLSVEIDVSAQER